MQGNGEELWGFQQGGGGGASLKNIDFAWLMDFGLPLPLLSFSIPQFLSVLVFVLLVAC